MEPAQSQLLIRSSLFQVTSVRFSRGDFMRPSNIGGCFSFSRTPRGRQLVHRSCFRNRRMRSHTRTVDEDVFVPFLQAFRKRRFVVQTG